MKFKRVIALLLVVLSVSAYAAPVSLAYYDKALEDENSKYICVKETRRDSDGSGYEQTFVYDKKGNLVKRVDLNIGMNGDTSKYVTKLQYDKKGRVVKEIWKDSDENRISVTVNTYDAAGNLIKEVSTDKESDGTVTKQMTKFTYDKKGNLTKRVRIPDCTEPNHKIVFRWAFDSAGREIRTSETEYTASVAYIEETHQYTRDPQGHVLKEVAYFGGNGRTEVTEYTYNKKGNPVTETYTSTESDGSEYHTQTVYTYDKKGRTLEEAGKWHDSDGTSGTFGNKSAYDENGNEIKYIYYETKAGAIRFQDSFSYTYDGNGHMVKCVETMMDSDGRRNKYIRSYAYDQKGNCTKEVITEHTQDGSRKTKTLHTFDSKGHDVKTVTLYYGEKGEKLGKDTVTATYDQAGNLVREAYLTKEADGTSEKQVFTYQYIKNPKR